MSDKEELFDWLLSQDRIRIEKWNHCGGRESFSVWTIFDDEDEPSGRADTMLKAIRMAKEKSES